MGPGGSPLAPPGPWVWALSVPVVLGLLAWALRLVRRSAVAAGVPLGILVLRLGGIAGFAVLLAFFLLGTVLTRIGYAAKESRGVAEASGGRRGAAHVAANCGVGLLLLAALAALHLAPAGALGRSLWAAFVASFAAASSDTASSEIGQLLGRRPISLRSFRAVPIGTEGAVSLEGLLAGAAAAAILAAVGLAVGLVDGRGAIAVASGGFLGNLLESLAGGWGRRVLPHGGLNFANTAVGAALAGALTRLFGG